jgi:hypothetical protein
VKSGRDVSGEGDVQPNGTIKATQLQVDKKNDH